MSVSSLRSLTLSGIGLITGLPVTVTLQESPQGHGISFYLEDDTVIPAHLSSVVHSDRGVTLGASNGRTLSIVEHFLAACSLLGLSDLRVEVSGAPELPLLDGSSAPWLEALEKTFGHKEVKAGYPLSQAITYQAEPDIFLYALPAASLQVTYAVNFQHPDLAHRWVRWDSQQDGFCSIASARTFGFVKELPVLQAKGLAKGVTLENTLGLTDEGGYTAPLRLEDEPVRHKILDLLGDLTLTGINPLTFKTHIIAINAGHTSHLAFAKLLVNALSLA